MLSKLATTKSDGDERVLGRRLVEPMVVRPRKSKRELCHAALTPGWASLFQQQPTHANGVRGNKSAGYLLGRDLPHCEEIAAMRAFGPPSKWPLNQRPANQPATRMTA
jgi:hypothetical protein